MPKSKSKEKKAEIKESATITSIPISATTDMEETLEETKETISKTEDDDRKVIDEEASYVMNLSMGLRAGLEYWKMVIMGKPLFPAILQAYLTYKSGKPIKTDLIFKKIEKLKMDVLNDIEGYESILFSDLQSWLAIKKKSK